MIHKTRRIKHKQYGGKYLGAGSYGCVVSPALTCKSSRKISNSPKQSHNNTVSKIVLSPDNDAMEEINIAKRLKQLDPQQKYFITLNETCRLQQVPLDRTNITRVKYTNYNNTSLNSYRRLDKKKLDKKFCPIDLSLNPINLIMPNGGYDLLELAKALESKHKAPKDTTINHKLLTVKMLFKNLKECIKNLLLGLLKLHQNRIVNRDIKEANIVANYNTQTQTIAIRYIDWGFAEYLTPEYCKYRSNILLQGTYELIAPEIFIVYVLNEYNNKYNEHYLKRNIHNRINKYVKQMHNDLKLDITQLHNTTETLYTEITHMFNNNTILNKYFGINDILNGYVQKNDVYSLGITLYEFLYSYTKIITPKHNPQLHDLLKHMIILHPDTRYNVLQCINHPYFL